MQGEQAPASIMAAILEASEQPYDAILILRGGGSELDLSCFDDFNLAVTIATCPVPVVTAIGHDKDVHIADMVAHTAVKTPTALADLFLDALSAQDEAAERLMQRIAAAAARLTGRAELQLKSLDGQIQRSVQRRLGEMERVASEAYSRIRLAFSRKWSLHENALLRAAGRISKGLLGKYNQVARLADAAVHRLKFAASARVSQEISAIALKEARIKATDPRNILSLGYVLVTGKDHQILKTVEKVSRGDRIGVRFQDGSLSAKVDEVYSDKIDNDKVQIA